MTLKNDERNVMSQLYLKKAYKALQTTKEIKENDPETAIARAYYSMFYAAQSALVDNGITGLHRHEGANSNFGEQFVKTAIYAVSPVNYIFLVPLPLSGNRCQPWINLLLCRIIVMISPRRFIWRVTRLAFVESLSGARYS